MPGSTNLHTLRSSQVPGSEGLWSPRWSPDGNHLAAFNGSPEVGVSKIMLFTFATNTWQELVAGTSLAWESFSHNGKFVLFSGGKSLIRVDVSSHRWEAVASLSGFRATACYADRSIRITSNALKVLRGRKRGPTPPLIRSQLFLKAPRLPQPALPGAAH